MGICLSSVGSGGGGCLFTASDELACPVEVWEERTGGSECVSTYWNPYPLQFPGWTQSPSLTTFQLSTCSDNMSLSQQMSSRKINSARLTYKNSKMHSTGLLCIIHAENIETSHPDKLCFLWFLWICWLHILIHISAHTFSLIGTHRLPLCVFPQYCFRFQWRDTKVLA